ncbi:hypothetical protein CPHO_06995 [Corynebacterium phocae]|uniref:Uncharacterized protein n=1 Tax=Corynebacterium phocae TaxID=161895 RepID=A0A1L7D3U7_9CORY|nr:hypothetical protein [Corynebacterium phocae]APT92681.1 hypothetical protein CPHO_06995 [Corynebacterium phocae]KAA8723570.1 hypothetical protein F4V58_06510 [Corynebacterium phocae]
MQYQINTDTITGTQETPEGNFPYEFTLTHYVDGPLHIITRGSERLECTHPGAAFDIYGQAKAREFHHYTLKELANRWDRVELETQLQALRNVIETGDITEIELCGGFYSETKDEEPDSFAQIHAPGLYWDDFGTLAIAALVHNNGLLTPAHSGVEVSWVAGEEILDDEIFDGLDIQDNEETLAEIMDMVKKYCTGKWPMNIPTEIQEVLETTGGDKAAKLYRDGIMWGDISIQANRAYVQDTEQTVHELISRDKISMSQIESWVCTLYGPVGTTTKI